VVFNGGDTPANAVLSQSFATIAGRRYSLSFDYGTLYGNFFVPPQTLDVDVSNSDLPTQHAVTPSNGVARVVSRYSYSFVASSTSSTLTLTDAAGNSTTSADGFLDNVRVTSDPYPDAPHISNFSALQGANATQAITVNWDQMMVGGQPATVNDFVSFEVRMIDGSFEHEVFSSPGPGQPGQLNGTSTSATIPANTLEPGMTYKARLLFARPTTVDTTTYPPVLSIAAYTAVTKCDLVTAAPPSAPEVASPPPGIFPPPSSSIVGPKNPDFTPTALTYPGPGLTITLSNMTILPSPGQALPTTPGQPTLIPFTGPLAGGSISLNGSPEQQASGSVNGVATVTLTGVDGQGRNVYNTEILALDISGSAPFGPFMLRESPTLPSLGQTTSRSDGAGGFLISSFFDVFTELSTDGGQTWIPANGPGRFHLAPAP
jgi:hypothetical protein